MPFFPIFLFPSPFFQTRRGKKPRSGSVPASLGFPTPDLERGQAVYPFTSGGALFATRGTAATLFFFFALRLTVKGLRARGTPRGYLTKSAGERLKIQVAALKTFPVPFSSTDKVVTITFVR